tara:strand:+ start:238 stop:345 length:108 start_codon:yes stop_codon:yes gene_type:complete
MSAEIMEIDDKLDLLKASGVVLFWAAVVAVNYWLM